jgi:hypothetical protein
MTDDETDVDDDALLSLLGRALANAEPIPEGAHQAALDAFAFRDLDAELAELVEGSFATTRGDDDGPLVFATADTEIVVDRAGRDAVGQLSPPGPWVGWLESATHAVVPFRADDLGRFRVSLAGGPVRIVVELPAGAVRTDWFRR